MARIQTDLRRALTLSILLPFLLMVLLSGIFLVQVRQLLILSGWLDHSLQVIATAEKINRQMIGMETAMRGYIITSSKDRLEPYDVSGEVVLPQLSALQLEVQDEPMQVARVALIEKQYRHWKVEADRYILLKSRGEDVANLVRQRTAQSQLDLARQTFDEFIVEAEKLRIHRRNTVEATARRTIYGIVVLGVLWGLLIAFGSRKQVITLSDTYERAIRNEARSRQELEQSHAELETRVRDRTKELQHQQQFLSAVLENIEAGIVACDQNGRLTLFNRASREFHGMDKSPLAPSEWSSTYDLFAADGTTKLKTEDIPLYRALQGNRFRGYEMVIAPKNGPKRVLLTAGQPLLGESGERLGAVVAMHDITPLKESEDRQGTLLKQQAESNVALEAANRELEAFCYSVSHDLRAPLRGIDGFSQALLDDYGSRLDDMGRKYLGFVRDGVQRMGTLIDDLLNLSRLSRVELRGEAVSMHLLAQDIIDQLKSQDPKRIVEFKNIAENLGVVRADPGLIGALLQNLLSNAWKFTAKRPLAAIEFGVENEVSGPVYYIRDNGAGFDMAFENKLFGAFQRLHSTQEFSGTGVGLATVRRIAHRHGGRTWAQGKVDEGATFFFTLG